MTIANHIEPFLRDVQDFPKPGILFKDITPLLANPAARKMVVKDVVNYFSTLKIDAVAAIEARGFILGSLIAYEMDVPFLPIRKSGKLPYHTIKEDYNLEYGTASIEMHVDSVKKDARILIHDDLLATGGTATAAGNLIKRLGGQVVGYSFLINLSFLPGEQKLKEQFHLNPHYLVNY